MKKLQMKKIDEAKEFLGEWIEQRIAYNRNDGYSDYDGIQEQQKLYNDCVQVILSM